MRSRLDLILDGAYSDMCGRDTQKRSYIGNSLFSLFYKVRNEGGRFEVPVIVSSSIYNKIFDNCRNKSMIVPLNVHDGIIPMRGMLSALRQGGFSYRGGLIRMRINSFNFYVGKGVILDSFLNPLLLCSISGDSNSQNKHNIENLQAHLYVTPKVFLQESIVDKFIIKNIIPYYVSHDLRFILGDTASVTVDIIVKDVSNYLFYKPVNPDEASMKGENIEEYLLNNMDSIMKVLE